MIQELLTTQNYVIISLVLGSFLLYKYTQTKDKLPLIHAALILWSGLIYTNFFYNFIPLETTYYVDWILSTPLIVLAFGYTLTGGFTKKVLENVLLQVMVIATGFIALSSSQPLLWFGLGLVLMLTVFYNFVEMGAFKLQPVLSIVLIGSFSLYPYVWWVTSGNLLEASTLLIALPLVSKHLFSVLDVYFS